MRTSLPRPLNVDVERIRARIHEDMPSLREALVQLISIPSVAFAGHDHEPIDRAAHVTADLLRRAGLSAVDFIQVPPDPPAVYASRPARPGFPTVLLYAHYDVQPPGPDESWQTPPYGPETRGGRLFGRGSADDKAGIVAHLGALRADVAGGVGIKVLIEGAEETGSSGLEKFVPEQPDLLAADVIVVCDLVNVALGVPTLTTSLRGLAALDVTLESLAAPVHSGSYGGVVPDALVALVRLLATLHDESGVPAVEGLIKIPYSGDAPTEDKLRAEAGVLPGVNLIGQGSIGERLFTAPAINVIGMDVPDLSNATNSVVAKATARVSARIAPSQDPGEAIAALISHLKARIPWHLHATFAEVQVGRGYMAPARGRRQQLAQWALQVAYGRPLAEIGEGGSVPLVATFHDVAPSADIILHGPADPLSNTHGPNESIDLDDLERGTLAEALLLAALSETAHS